MASLYHHMVSHTDLSYGVLPPSREGLLEIQVNKLINDYLFSDSEEKSSPSSHSVEANASSFALKTNMPLSSSHEIKACNVGENRSRALETQVYASYEHIRTTMGSFTKQELQASTIVESISSSYSSIAWLATRGAHYPC